ncbi:hypothetical protein [Thiocapsa bogorovii]|uniref:hypothetical protein n=1 Tax=Thiocapsa bogorovii TaxID=521689 RepID=UPI001E579AD1|nr:hypothetical protein [Thiocapsa bogorovii]UHD16106.1 hypothetical protein LT988_23125 [Thiocapsa bogorovii]
MPIQPIAIKSTGLVTSVGLSAPAACAAIRAKISNPTETRFMGSDGEWIMAHQVPLAEPWRGLSKLTKMAAMAIAECLDGIPSADWASIPLLLCVAERERPGRLDGLDEHLFLDIENELGSTFSPESTIIAAGRVGVAVALSQARKLIYEGSKPRVLIAATDSLLTWPTLNVYEREDRLLTAGNSDGFMPGEAGGALLVGLPHRETELICPGVGFGFENAHVRSDQPLKAEGLASAIKESLRDAGRTESILQFRVTDVSGEQYYFKEASLAFSRLDRTKRKQFDFWHPAECVGQTGSAIGIVMLAVLKSACEKRYAKGDNILAHVANDNGKRASMILAWHSKRT